MVEFGSLSRFLGRSINDVIPEALTMAQEHQDDVHFAFNGTDMVVSAEESPEEVYARWQADNEAEAKAYREDPQRLVEAKERLEKRAKEEAATMVDTSSSEAEMREAKVPWPLNERQLSEYVDSLVNKPHDYGTCVYAMSMAGTAAYNYVAGKLGVTGFQASCADLDILRRTRSIKGPFILLTAEDAMYPQLSPERKLEEAMESWKPWLKGQAEKELQDGKGCHPDVLAHWKHLATNVPTINLSVLFFKEQVEEHTYAWVGLCMENGIVSQGKTLTDAKNSLYKTLIGEAVLFLNKNTAIFAGLDRAVDYQDMYDDAEPLKYTATANLDFVTINIKNARISLN